MPLIGEAFKGLFSLLHFVKDVTDALARHYAIYMPRTDRINLAGLSNRTAPPLVNAVKELDPILA